MYIFLIWVLRPVKLFHSFWAKSIVRWAKTGDPQEKPPYYLQAKLGLSLMWPELGSNLQQWDDKWIRALKISILTHSAMGFANIKVCWAM